MQSRDRDIVKEIVEYLRLNPSAKPSEIARVLGLNVNTVRKIMYRLRAKGILIKTPYGYTIAQWFLRKLESKSSPENGVIQEQTSVMQEHFETHEYSEPESIVNKVVDKNAENVPEESASTALASPTYDKDDLSSKLNELKNSLESLIRTVNELDKRITMFETKLGKLATSIYRVVEAFKRGDPLLLDEVLAELNELWNENQNL